MVCRVPTIALHLSAKFCTCISTGVQLVLWVTCALYLWKLRQRGRQTLLLLCYITLLLIVETIFSVVQARTVQVIYIENRNYPGGPWQYFLDTQYLAINVIFYATLFVITFLCDLLVVSLCSSHPVFPWVLNKCSFGVAGSSGGLPAQ